MHENVNKFRASSPDFIKTMRKIIPDSAKFTLDLKQAVRSGYSPFEILDSMGNSLKHIHINDHTNGKDCLLPFYGDFNYKEFFSECRKISYDGDVIIEIYKNNFDDVTELMRSAEKLSKLL